MKKITLAMLGLFALAGPCGSALAGVDEMANKCNACHGDGGNSSHEEVPNIAGMSEAYIHDTMMAYQAGDRPGKKYTPEGGEESDMNTVAKALGEDDINALAAHYAALTFQPHAQPVDAEMAKAGKKHFLKNCKKCHSEGGSVADDDAGILAGQWKAYLHHEFELFDSGEREMPKKMAKRFEKLSDEEKAELIEFLAGGGK
ncbi:c-type cytochrome [Endothiovibrio diazotrophicus]